MTPRTIVLLFLGAALLAACGSDDSEGSSAAAAGAGGGTSVSTTSAATSGSGGGGVGGATSASTGVGGAGGAEPVAPEAPDMKSAMKMSGALHVSWTNIALDGDAVHLFRNENGGAFEEAYVLTGAATSQHDTAASDSSVTYCYHAQCERDGLLSADSDEVCGTP